MQLKGEMTIALLLNGCLVVESLLGVRTAALLLNGCCLVVERLTLIDEMLSHVLHSAKACPARAYLKCHSSQSEALHRLIHVQIKT